jgi:hypothetical protein
MPSIVEKDKPLDPVCICFLCSVAVVAAADSLSHLIKKSRSRGARWRSTDRGPTPDPAVDCDSRVGKAPDFGVVHGNLHSWLTGGNDTPNQQRFGSCEPPPFRDAKFWPGHAYTLAGTVRRSEAQFPNVRERALGAYLLKLLSGVKK